MHFYVPLRVRNGGFDGVKVGQYLSCKKNFKENTLARRRLTCFFALQEKTNEKGTLEMGEALFENETKFETR